MKILVIQTPHYDFNSATLIEGLHCLIEKGEDIQLGCTEESNYAKTDKWNYHLNDSQITTWIHEADIIAVTSNQGVREDLLNNTDRVVYIDGEDTYPYKKDPSNYVLYFKREMRLSEEHVDNVRPFPFGIERRYYQQYSPDIQKDVFLSCMFGPHDDYKPWRKWIEQTCANLSSTKVNYDNDNEQNIHHDVSLKNIIHLDDESEKKRNTALVLSELQWVIGQNYGNAGYTSVDTGNRDHGTYYDILARSQITIDAYGAYGCNAARFWEGLANGCLVMTQPFLLHMPQTESGIYFIQFSDEVDLITRIEHYANNIDELQLIAKRGYDFGKKYHTTEARAIYFIDECRRAGLI